MSALLSSIAGGGGLPKLTSITKKTTNGYVSDASALVASLGAGQALQTVLNITTPVSIGLLLVGGASTANTVDRIIITSDLGVLYDGNATNIINQSSWFVGVSMLISNGSTVGYLNSTQQFRMESLKIELETTSSTSLVEVFSDLELIQ